ncbi:DUF6683 family protein [Sphingomonas corticis]|uniref:Uncharacterized protein n=1 Tax=Sphingomonas corticis TaxID=2722791 RepID=A0ABX1CQ29_9SPHN|nr:DUF6683 family protein [Sphingomonas corticis]NJR78472.1 hypothetical protein [Sphingomonas corticis]
MTRLGRLLIGALTMIAPPAAAQDVVMALDPTLMTGWSGVAAAGEYAKRDFGTRLSRSSARRSALAATPAATAARLAYQPDAAVRNRVYGRTIAQIEKSSPKDAAQVRQLLMSGAMRRDVARHMARYGMSPNNLADTTGLYLATAWMASRGSNADPTPAQMKGLRAQVAGVMAGMPAMAGASNATKAEIAEANIVQAAFASAAGGHAARDASFAPTVRSAVVRGVKGSYQMDLSRLNLTNSGLR